MEDSSCLSHEFMMARVSDRESLVLLMLVRINRIKIESAAALMHF